MSSPTFVSEQALTMELQATGSFQKFEFTPLMTTEEARLAMQKVKDTKSGYTPPAGAATGTSVPPATTGTTK